jgi:hypothetical protein
MLSIDPALVVAAGREYPTSEGPIVDVADSDVIGAVQE